MNKQQAKRRVPNAAAPRTCCLGIPERPRLSSPHKRKIFMHSLLTTLLEELLLCLIDPEFRSTGVGSNKKGS